MEDLLQFQIHVVIIIMMYSNLSCGQIQRWNIVIESLLYCVDWHEIRKRKIIQWAIKL